MNTSASRHLDWAPVVVLAAEVAEVEVVALAEVAHRVAAALVAVVDQEAVVPLVEAVDLARGFPSALASRMRRCPLGRGTRTPADHAWTVSCTPSIQTTISLAWGKIGQVVNR